MATFKQLVLLPCTFLDTSHSEGVSYNFPKLVPAKHNFILLFVFLCIFPLTTQSKVVSYNFPSFGPAAKAFMFSQDTAMSQGSLQITPDSGNNRSQIANKSGRVMFMPHFDLWKQTSGATLVASFNTSFTINIRRLAYAIPGEGFAFIIAPSADGPPINSSGQYLGLTNSTTDGNAANCFIAVELDTVKQDFDPDDNHVGLNINSVRSNLTSSLMPLGIEISPENSTNHNVWIDYDGGKRHIWVYMSMHNLPKPAIAVLQSPLDLSLYIQPQSFFGFAAATGDLNMQLNCVKSWNLTVEILPVNKPGRQWKLAVAVALSVLVVIVISGLLIWYICYVKKGEEIVRNDPNIAGTLRNLPGNSREFEYKILRKATNNFDEKMKLGQGGFGIVYKGVIPGEDTEVAVKKFSRENTKGQADFLAEVCIINRLRHKHLVRLLGWCHHNGMLMLVYEYMPNGSLDRHLFGPPECPILTWNLRCNILSGVASALQYLHNEYDQKVVHRDLKASNVLLDSSFNSRLGDFGLARALATNKTSYTEGELGGVAGTIGYIAPECFHTGKATTYSDIFGFGAVILEVVCGRKPRCDISGFLFLVDWVWKLHREDRILSAVDPRLGGQFVEEDAVRLLLLGLACSHPIPMERPKTAMILPIISGSVAPPLVPPFKPGFVWEDLN